MIAFTNSLRIEKWGHDLIWFKLKKNKIKLLFIKTPLLLLSVNEMNKEKPSFLIHEHQNISNSVSKMT